MRQLIEYYINFIYKMKTKIFAICLILAGFSFLYNCSKKEESPSFDDQLHTLYDKTKGLKSAVIEDSSPEAKISIVQRVGKDHLIAVNFIKELQLNGFNKELLDLQNIKRYLCVDTDISTLSVSLKDGQQEIVAYCYNDKYCIITISKDGNMLNYKSLNGDSFISLKNTNGLYYIDSIKTNVAIQTFSDYVYASELKEAKVSLSLKSAQSEEGGYSCCRKAPGVSECVGCTLGAMPALLSLGAAGLAAAAASCVGAGPDAWC